MLDVNKIWKELKSNNDSEEFFNLRTYLLKGINFHFLWRVPENNISFGVDLKYDIPISEQFKHLTSLSLEKLKIASKEEIIVINLLDNDLKEPFHEFIQTLVNIVLAVEDNEIAQDVFLDKIVKFQKLFEKGRFGKLKKTEIRGLYAELCFLEHLIENTTPRALDSWQGPHNGLHDFVMENYAVEVKSYMSQQSVRVLNERQLDPYSSNKLFLATFHIQEDPSGISINEKIEILEKKFAGKLKLQFISTLNDSGYFKTHAIYYEKFLLKENTRSLYQINTDFPSNKVLNLNPEIFNIKYQLDLTKCDKWLIEFDKHLEFYEKN